MILFAVDTGMRWSEIVGLRRQKLDLANRKVRVTEQLVRLEDGSFVRREPKTSAGTRSITISPFTADLLVDRFAASGNRPVGVHQRVDEPDHLGELPDPSTRTVAGGSRTVLSLP